MPFVRILCFGFISSEFFVLRGRCLSYHHASYFSLYSNESLQLLSKGREKKHGKKEKKTGRGKEKREGGRRSVVVEALDA